MNYNDLPGWFDNDFMKVYDRLVYEAPENAIIVEVGSWKGKSGAYLLEQIRKSNKSIHVWFVDLFANDVFGKTGEIGSDLPNFLDNIFQCGFKDSWFHKANWDKEPTKFSWQTFSSDSIRFAHNVKSVYAVMLDGNHERDYVKQEILAWKPKTKIITGHDFFDPQIYENVNELLPNRENCGSCYLAYL